MGRLTELKTTITVSNRREGEQIRAGLEDPNVRAFVKIMGTLNGLPSAKSRQMVLSFVADSIAERANMALDDPAAVP